MPWDTDHKDWAVLSTDIVVERIVRKQLKTEAYSVKRREEVKGAKAKSVANNFAIESAFWRYQKASCRQVISNDFSQNETANIQRLYDELNLYPSKATIERKQEYSDYFLSVWTRDQPLEEILSRVEKCMKLSQAEGWNLFAAAIQSGQLPVDLKQELGERKRVFLKRRDAE